MVLLQHGVLNGARNGGEVGGIRKGGAMEAGGVGNGNGGGKSSCKEQGGISRDVTKEEGKYGRWTADAWLMIWARESSDRDAIFSWATANAAWHSKRNLTNLAQTSGCWST